MEKLTRALIFFAAALASACAQSAETGTEGNVIFELQVTGYAGHGEDGSLLATQLYAEKPLPSRDVSVFLVAHRDQDFHSVYAGLARKFGELQLGVGFGSAWYAGIQHPTVNPWLYYGKENVEAYLTVEHYAHDEQAPWFYKGYASRRIADSFFIGAYGEKDLGVGPMIRWRNGSLRIWVAVPVVSRLDAGVRGVAGIQIEF